MIRRRSKAIPATETTRQLEQLLSSSSSSSKKKTKQVKKRKRHDTVTTTSTTTTTTKNNYRQPQQSTWEISDGLSAAKTFSTSSIVNKNKKHKKIIAKSSTVSFVVNHNQRIRDNRKAFNDKLEKKGGGGIPALTSSDGWKENRIIHNNAGDPVLPTHTSEKPSNEFNSKSNTDIREKDTTTNTTTTVATKVSLSISSLPSARSRFSEQTNAKTNITEKLALPPHATNFIKQNPTTTLPKRPKSRAFLQETSYFANELSHDNTIPKPSSKLTKTTISTQLTHSSNNSNNKVTATDIKTTLDAPKRTAANTENYVRLNLRNSAGSCRGAKNKSSKNSWNRNKEQDMRKNNSTSRPMKIDPLDDFLDGTIDPSKTSKNNINAGKKKKNDQSSSTNKDTNNSNIPLCHVHQRPCKELVVKKKSSMHQGRKFYVCSFPRGEQCNFFEWADNTIEAAQQSNFTYSGFVARQVALHTERLSILTVPELREQAKQRGLSTGGKKQELLMRLSLFVRDELVVNGGDAGTDVGIKENQEKREQEGCIEIDEQVDTFTKKTRSNNNLATLDNSGDDGDDSSTSSFELEMIGESADSNNSPSDSIYGSDDEDSEEENEDVDEDLSESIEEVDNTKDQTSKDVRNSAKNAAATTTIQQNLFDLFGYDSFRSGQEWAIERCLSQKRSLLVAPTGFGKSLCYAIPAFRLEGVCIVISPLISLMEDQLRQLPPRIPAATLSGFMSSKQMACTIHDVLQERIKILFVSPERFTAPSFRRLFRYKWDNGERKRPFPVVSLLCIDEAHCMSQWAHNFRPSYMRIRTLLDSIKPRSVLAMTATAGPPIVQDIVSSLDIEETKIMNSDRDNIDVYCQMVESEESRLVLLLRLLKKKASSKSKTKATKVQQTSSSLAEGSLANDNVIIYVWRQHDANVIGEALQQEAAIEGGVVVYHGGMDARARTKSQSLFLRGKARICVATVAFGMGINKGDVDAVLHLCLPSSLEHYLQEIGRAGRDGRPAKAMTLLLRDEQEEVCRKHSLAHSDLISKSQIETLLGQIRKEIKLVETDLQQIKKEPSESSPHRRIFVSIPIERAIQELDAKVETIETLLALMETHGNNENNINGSLQLEGRFNDEVTMVLKRHTLEQLQQKKNEAIASCILQCGTRISNEKEENLPSRMQKSISYSKGAYTFSVSRCANLLGDRAEPRHVYATLRRLEQQGDVELLFDKKGEALQIQLFLGSDDNMFDDDNNDLAEMLWTKCTNQVSSNAKKVSVIDSILRQVAAITDDDDDNIDDDRDGEKSKRLKKFQELVNDELSKLDKDNGGDAGNSKNLDLRESKNMFPKHLPTSCCQELLYDAQAIWHFLINDANCTELDVPGDYTILTLTKFLHGIETIKTSEFGKYHDLFGKWKTYEFESIRCELEKRLE